MNFTALRALIIDIDGTLLRGEKPLPGLSPFFAFLHQHKITFVVATNNATKTPQASLAATGVQPDAVFGGLVELTEAWQQSLQNR